MVEVPWNHPRIGDEVRAIRNGKMTGPRMLIVDNAEFATKRLVVCALPNHKHRKPKRRPNELVYQGADLCLTYRELIDKGRLA